MRLKQLVEQRVNASASGESLRPLSAKEVQRVAGAEYLGPSVIGGPVPHPIPGVPGYPLPFPSELYQNL